MELKINALADGNAEILIYGDIGSKWYDGVNPQEFAAQLKQCTAEILTVRINSNGGDMISGHAIYNLIKSYHGKVRCVVDGIAASAASIIAMAGELLMPKNTMLMIHNAKSASYGDSKKMESVAKSLQIANQTMIEVYASKTGLSHEVIQDMMDKETYMTAEEAVKNGFADEVLDDIEINACLDGDELLLNGIKLDSDVSKKFIDFHPEITAKIHASNQTKQAATQAANFLDKGSKVITIEALKKDNPDLYAAVYESGKNDGINAGKELGIVAERQRLQAIDELETTGFSDIVAKAKYETGCSAGDVAVLVLKAQKDNVNKIQQNIAADAGVVNALTASQTDPLHGIDPQAQAEEAFLAGIKDYIGAK